EIFDSIATLWLPDENGVLQIVSDSSQHPENEAAREESVAQWAFDHRQPAGKGTDTLPGSQGFYMPLLLSGNAVGVLGVAPRDKERSITAEHIHLLETFASQAAAALERAFVAEIAEKTKVEAENEKL